MWYSTNYVRQSWHTLPFFMDWNLFYLTHKKVTNVDLVYNKVYIVVNNNCQSHQICLFLFILSQSSMLLIMFSTSNTSNLQMVIFKKLYKIFTKFLSCCASFWITHHAHYKITFQFWLLVLLSCFQKNKTHTIQKHTTCHAGKTCVPNHIMTSPLCSHWGRRCEKLAVLHTGVTKSRSSTLHYP